MAELTIEVSPDELKPFLDEAVVELSNQTNIPGFRRGFAPYEVIKAELGEMKIYQEAAERAVARTFGQAILDNDLTTVGRPDIRILKLAPGNPFSYTAIVPLLPTVQIGPYIKLKIPKKKIEVPEQEILNLLEELRQSFATETIVKRKAKIGDRIEADVQTLLDRVPLDAGSGKNQAIILGKGVFLPGFEEHLVGLSAGEEKEFFLSMPKTYYRKDLAGKTIQCKVRVNTVYERTLQPLDDTLARRVGRFETLNALKDQLRNNLREEKEIDERRRWEAALMDAILKKSVFGEIPELLIESEIHKMIHEFEHEVAQQGMKFEDYLAHRNKTRKTFEQELRPAAQKRIQTALILREVAKRESISVPEEEVESERKRQIERSGANRDELQYVMSNDYMQYLKNILVSQKVFEFLERVNA